MIDSTINVQIAKQKLGKQKDMHTMECIKSEREDGVNKCQNGRYSDSRSKELGCTI